MITHAVVRTDARRAGDLLRYSGWPVLVPQTNAHHTWNVMRILVQIWPHPPSHVLIRALHHDSGELGSVDVPYPHKRDNPVLRAEVNRLEEQSLLDQGIDLPRVEPLWAQRLKAADLLEMMEKGHDELIMGNRLGQPIVNHICEDIGKIEWVDALDKERVQKYVSERCARYTATMNGDVS